MTKLSPWITWVFLLALTFTGTVTSGGQLQKVAVRVDGLACPFCAYGMEKKLERIDGVEKMDIKINEGLVRLYFSEDAQIDQALIEKKSEGGRLYTSPDHGGRNVFSGGRPEWAAQRGCEGSHDLARHYWDGVQ